jgi:hypothetical protein
MKHKPCKCEQARPTGNIRKGYELATIGRFVLGAVEFVRRFFDD